MSLRDEKFKYLLILKNYVPNDIGFDDAFSNIDPMYLKVLANLVIKSDKEKVIYIDNYDEALDFIDGNGFKVEGNDTNGYLVSLLNT